MLDLSFVIQDILEELTQFLTQPNAYRSVLILVILIIVAYWLSRFMAKGIIRIAQFIAVRADNTSDEARVIQLRRVETYLSITIAIVRALIVATVAYAAWRFISPSSNSSAAAVGASAFFIVIAGATIGMVLRDITAGATMIIERWFHVGDYIRIEPFLDVGGVVERMTLRSTRLRSLNGEVIWLHNQHIQGVRVTPKGLRTIAVDVLVNDEEKGLKLIEKVVATIPTGTMTVAKKLRIVRALKWGDDLWMYTVQGQTPPGREWLIEKFFVDSLVTTDKKTRNANIIAYEPMVRYEDPAAERSFKRAVRVAKQEGTEAAKSQ